MRSIFTSVILLAILCVSQTMAQQIETVNASATYLAPPTMSPKEARYQTILRAQESAIAKTFGTIVSEENLFFTREKNQQSFSDFFNIHDGDIRGIWLETIGDTIWSNPILKNDGSCLYEVRLKGKIMELKNAPIAIEIKLLYNGTDHLRNEIRNFSFNDGDDMYLYFKSPVDGYLAVYVVDFDDNMTTQRLIPYPNQPGGVFNVTSDTEYILFSESLAEPGIKHLVRSCRMRSRTNHDFNQFYIIFSPNSFVKALDKNINEDLPNVVNFRDFQHWLSKNRRKDLQMCVEKIFVDIVKK